MKAVIYARVSTKEQATNLSLPTQIEACRDYCARQGLEVDQLFVEEGESAKTANRSEFQRMLVHCRESQGRIQYLVVYALNRFARDQFDHYAVRAHLHRLGVSLRSVTEPIDESSSGKLMEGILASFAQFDNDVRSERTSAGMQEALRRGQWTFQAPLGYERSLTAEGQKTLGHDPDRAPQIRAAFEAIARGETAASALKAANAAGLTTRRGRPVSAQTWTKLVSNPIYSGRIIVPKWNIDTEGNFEPIVTRDLFLDAQRVLTGRAHTAKVHLQTHRHFPLRHFLRCDFCDTPMTAGWSRSHTGSQYGYYWCRNGCAGQRTTKGELEERWIDFLESLRPTPEFLAVFEATVLASWKSATKEAELRRRGLQVKLEQIRSKKERLLEVYVYEAGIDKQTFESQSLKLSEAGTIAEMELRDARLEELDIEGLLEYARHVALNSGKLWFEAPHEGKLKLQNCLFPGGAKYRNGAILNPVKCPIFSDLEAIQTGDYRMASPTGFEPVLPA